MPQVSVTLSEDDFRRLEKVAKAYGHRPGGLARILAMDRLGWIERGFGLNHDRLETLIEVIAQMDSDELSRLENSLKKKR